jgi:hypothetical protein
MNTDIFPQREECSCEITPSQKEVLRGIFMAILKFKRAPRVEELTLSLKKSADDIIRVLDSLEEIDLLVRSKGTQHIVSIYPLSLAPTKHQVVLKDGKKLFAMCAIDALGVANMFNINVEAISQCEWCQQTIDIEIKNGEVVTKSHPQILIWSPRQRETPAAKTCCPLVNFFCSGEHLKEWQDKNTDLAKKGHSALLDQAYPEIKDRWKRYGQTIGIR